MNKQKQEFKQANIEKIRELINLNPDSRQYFYTKADESWLSWLWENGFLDVIKQRAEDPTHYGYITPEINYLVKVSGEEPTKVVDIMLALPISSENFNPVVTDRFLRICSALPAKELKRIVQKIRDEKWPQLMGKFNEWGFEYKEMFQTLAAVNDFDSILILAETVLSVRTKKELEQVPRGFSSDNLFYFNNLSYTKVFEYLLKIDELNIKRALFLVTNIMSQIIFLGGEENKDEVFEIYDRFFPLDDVDIFTLEVEKRNGLSHINDVKNLVAVIKQYAERTIGKKCGNTKLTTKLYGKYFESLPDSHTIWRLQLFVLSLCPEDFKEKLKNAFFRLFHVESYYEIISGTEYEKALQKGFSILSAGDKRDYVRQVIEYFSKHVKDKEDQKWHKIYGSRILSIITDQLTQEERGQIEKIGFSLDPSYKPGLSIGPMYSGFVRPRGPMTQEEFGELSIIDIIQKLRTDWVPEKLRRQNTNDDFLNPLNSEGVSELLKTDIPKRLQDYINNADLFFERDILDQNYTYSFLRDIQEVLRGNKADISGINWDNLIVLCTAIKESGEAVSFDQEKRNRNSFDAWLVGWDAVHSAMADVIQELLSEENGKILIDFSRYRGKLFEIINYLLTYSDPVPEDEKIESAGMKTKSSDGQEYQVMDPYSMAINTVRGRAFQVFALFVYEDSKKFPKEEKQNISSDVKELYEMVLKDEKTRALMFMFGHYLPSFYFRDKKWIQKLLPQIFSVEPEKKHLYTSAWEGYLSANLYEEIFFNPDIQKIYERGLVLTDAEFPKQKHFKEPDEGVAIHLALAFMHFSKFGFEHNLFKKFWGTPNQKRQKEFISFIGRHSISRESAAEWIKNNKIDMEKLKKFWDWALENCSSDVITGFGFWINVECGVLDIKWLVKHTHQTLQKTKGYVEWEYALVRSLKIFAKESPEDTLEILRVHLLEEIAKHEPIRTWLHIDTEVFDTFKELYKNDVIKERVRTLINDLLPYRGGLFWGLKSVLENNGNSQQTTNSL